MTVKELINKLENLSETEQQLEVFGLHVGYDSNDDFLISDVSVEDGKILLR